MDFWQFILLYEVVFKNCVEVCFLLFSYGVDFMLVNCYGKSVVDMVLILEFRERLIYEFKGYFLL